MAEEGTPAAVGTMDGICYDWSNDTFVLKGSLPIPEPGDGELRIKVLCCGLNPVDAKMKFWKGMIGSEPDVFVPGLDVVGVVDAIGPNVGDGFEVGRKVLYHGNMLKASGGLAPYAIHDALTTLPVEDSWSAAATDAQLAAIPCAGWTAFKVCTKLNLADQTFKPAKDNTLLVYGASGGVGSFLIQYAAHYQVGRIIAVCSAKNHEFVKSIGATDTVDYSGKELDAIKEEVMALTEGLGVDYAVATVGQETANLCADMLAFDGTVVPVVANAEPEKVGAPGGFMRGLSFAQVTLGGGHAIERTRKQLRVIGQQATTIAIEAGFKIPVTAEIEMTSAPESLAQMIDAHTTGKIVVKMPD